MRLEDEAAFAKFLRECPFVTLPLTDAERALARAAFMAGMIQEAERVVWQLGQRVHRPGTRSVGG